MKTSKLLLTTAFSAALISCVDSGYNMSDIDKSIRVNVNDLVVPIKMDDIKLETVLDIENNDKIKTINGEYAILIDGNFKSSAIEIPTFTTAGTSRSTTDQLAKMYGVSASSKQRKAPSTSDVIVSYPLSKKEMSFKANASDVNKAIASLSGLDLNTQFDFTILVDKNNALTKYLKSVCIENVIVQLPAGIRGTAYIINKDGSKTQCTSYDPNTGVLSFQGERIKLEDGKVLIHIDIDGCTQALLDGVLKEMKASTNKEFVLEKKYYISDGYIAIREEDFSDEFIASVMNAASAQRRLSADVLQKLLSQLPETIEYETKEELSSFEVTSISGSVNYSVDNFSLDPIQLNDIPSILKETGTRIRLANPQIYLQLTNPVKDADGTIPANTGLKLTSVAQDGTKAIYQTDNAKRLDADKALNTFVLSPSAVSVPYGDYTNPTHIPFTTLSNVLDNNGVPQSIMVEATDPMVQDDNVNNLQLGQNFGSVTGKYTFYAPLELTDNSVIAYADTIADWDDADVKKITVTNLHISADVSTDTPLELKLEIWPIDAKRQPLATAGSAIIQSNAKGQSIDIDITGTITNLDGIVIKATANSKDSGALRPDMKLHLENLKPKITGYYDTEM